jgi:hypothetical protein
MSELVFIECDPAVLAAQVGRMNIMCISGGRVVKRDTGIDLPVSNGYRVTIDLAANDTYVVRRVFKRGDKEWIKGERSNVYCDEVSEVAYYAGMFRSHPDAADWSAEEVD